MLYNLDEVYENEDENYDPMSPEEVNTHLREFLMSPSKEELNKFLKLLTEDDLVCEAIWILVKTHIGQYSSSYSCRVIADRAEDIIKQMILEGIV